MREYRATYNGYPNTLTFADMDHVSARGFAYDRLVDRLPPAEAAKLHPRDIAIVDVECAGYDREISGIRTEMVECGYTGSVALSEAARLIQQESEFVAAHERLHEEQRINAMLKNPGFAECLGEVRGAGGLTLWEQFAERKPGDKVATFASTAPDLFNPGGDAGHFNRALIFHGIKGKR